MADQGAFNLDQTPRNVPGITQLWSAADRSNFGNGSFFALRGFQIKTYLRNGIPANVSTTMENDNIESVEVLKELSATLLVIVPSITYQASVRLSFSFEAELYVSKGTAPQILFSDASAPPNSCK